jgi:hypothetical protein
MSQLHDPLESMARRLHAGPVHAGAGRFGREQVAWSGPSICTWQWIALLLLSPGCFPPGAAGAESSELLSPLAREVLPSAGFGEIAPGIAHTGIDFPTSGRVLPVAAASDGEIVRVRVSGGGYGRVLHLSTADGREILYAHLSQFTPALEESCRAMQERSGTYELDWRPLPGSFPVPRGAWIGRTGETEDGRPLLHLEVRVDGSPRNPLACGFDWPDETPPRIHEVQFVPLGPSARVDGGLDPRTVLLGQGGSGRSPGLAAVLWGPIGLLCVSADEWVGQRTAPWRVTLEMDGAEQYTADVGRRLGPGGWNPDGPEPAGVERFTQRLYDPMEGDRGKLACGTALAVGTHRVRLVSRDAAANADTVEFLVLVQPTPRVEEWMARPLETGARDLGVRVGSLGTEDPERILLWVDLTEDGRRFPVRTLLGHLGAGWFLGEVSPLVPGGGIGMRVRLRTASGLESWGPVQSLDPEGRCGEAVIDSPSVVPAPGWIMLSFPAGCIPSRTPSATLRLRGVRIACELLETPPDEGDAAAWRFLGGARGAGAGDSPQLELRLDGRLRRWEMNGLFLATPRSELRWTSPDSALTLEIAAGTFYKPVWLSWTRIDQPGGALQAARAATAGRSQSEQAEDLIARSDVEAIGPEGAEMDGAFRISIRPKRLPETDEETRRLRIFGRRDGREVWHPLGGRWTGRAIVTVVDHLEEWVVMEDRSEPWIYGLEPPAGARRVGGITELGARIREEGSGISFSGFQVLLDGKRIPAAWNPWSRGLRVAVPDGMAPGTHWWEIRATDDAGNEARRVAEFTLIGRP